MNVFDHTCLLCSRPAPRFCADTSLSPLQSARTVHEVVAAEHRILESVNYELGTYTPAEWESLFEVRLPSRVQQLRQRSPQVTCSLLSRVPSGVLASGALCIADEYVQDRPFSVDFTPSRMALLLQHVRSSACKRVTFDGVTLTS